MAWTQFMDMHSGGGLKEGVYEYIYIEAEKEEAKIIFFNRFGHNPERVSCSCCGEDYSISSHKSLYQLTGYERKCRSLKPPIDPKTGRYKQDDPVMRESYYLEEGQEVPAGYEVDTRWQRRPYQTLEDYLKEDYVLVIRAEEIKPEERTGNVPEQGWVYID